MELQQTNGQDTEGRDTLYLLGGAAMIVFGAGLILIDADGAQVPGRHGRRQHGAGGDSGF